MNWQRLRSIIVKEIIQIKRDRASLAIIFVMPVMMLLLFGYAVTTDVENISIVVFDQAKTAESRQLVDAFTNSGYFIIQEFVEYYRDVESKIDSGTAKAGLIIPPDYTKRLKRKDSAQVQLLVDGSDPLVARTALSAAQVIAQHKSFVLKLQDIKKTGLPVDARQSIDLRYRIWYNPDMESVKFNIPGLIGLIMQNITVMLTGFALVRERERGTLEQLIITPVKPVELVAGKLVPYVVIAFMDVLLALMVGTFWFDVPVRGNLFLLLFLSFVFLLAALGFGMFISTVAKTQLQAMQMSILLMLPSVLLSGFMFPRDSMPPFVQFLGALLPLTYFLEILRGIILKGVGLEYIWKNASILAAFSVSIITMAALRLSKRLD
ncbi:ABC transporter [Thermincola ferriacetica]|uniref:Transport permease protein n=1 Tax=Thermincola ferriacetica TaxID=281456 RepID=A0A0L6W576_9FIRM|nr:ABC transporter permease [Thermincola ferriacetica]KNZ70249.1 ABC transporter [Thermincola ferriacetica]